MPIKLLRYVQMMKSLLEYNTLQECLSLIVRDMESEYKFLILGIFLKNEMTQTFRLKIGRNLSHSFQKRTEFSLGHPLINRLEKLETIADVKPDEIDFDKPCKNLVIFPLHYRGELRGFLFMDKDKYEEDELIKMEIFASLISLVVQIHSQESLIDRMNQFDALTGLLVYRSFLERTEIAFAQAKRYKNNLSLVVLKVNRYHDLYRKHGNVEADRIFTSIATILKGGLRVMEILGFIHPDTFLILLPENKYEDNQYVIKRLEKMILDRNDKLSPELLAWGVSNYSDELKNVERFITNTEECAFEAARRADINIVHYHELEKSEEEPEDEG